MRDPDGYYVGFCASDSLKGDVNEKKEIHENTVEAMSAISNTVEVGRVLKEQSAYSDDPTGMQLLKDAAVRT